MPKREGWKSLPVDVPEFIHDLFERLRDDYGDAHGVAPSQAQALSALIYAADAAALEAALRQYRAECKRLGSGHT